MHRVSLKIVGASGQGINSVGEVLAKGLKNAGYCVFGYREYPSLIKGGHASYQIDCSDEPIESSEGRVHILIALNHHGLQKNLSDVKDGGIVVHAVPGWKFSADDEKLLADRKIRVVFLPVEVQLQKLKAKPILGNILFSSFAWAMLGQKMEMLKEMVGERFKKKQDLLELNMRCIEEGFRYTDPKSGAVSISLPPSKEEWKKHLLLTGSHALGLGAVQAGVRFFAGYPMTPASSLLSYIAEIQNKTGMAIKQAEDEITAAQLVSGAMMMGTRALTSTSGGGFDLMSETLSLNGLIENPTVFVLAQRPGPATCLPTWTGQGDLLMAVYTAHGEFPRCVLSASGTADSFSLMGEAFNIAEEYQIPVILMTDKHVAEALYTQKPFEAGSFDIRRGMLVTKPADLKKLQSSDRYKTSTENGVSPRWLPGSAGPVYCAQGDEHTPEGATSEDAVNAKEQVDKRMRKLAALKVALPEPELTGPEDADILLVGWGSTRMVVLDAMRDDRLKGKKIAYLHYAYLWPMKTERFAHLARNVQKVILIEGNSQGQLGMLLRQECGIGIEDKILKYDGRPFYYDELVEKLLAALRPAPVGADLSPSLNA